MHRVDRAFADCSATTWSAAPRVNCHHNYTEQETPLRQGGVAVPQGRDRRAGAGDRGLIPGSMGTASYVVEGLGNPLALNSARTAPAGSSRRSAARRTSPGEQLDDAHGRASRGASTDAFLDEIPAPTRTSTVMADAPDLVRPVHTLRQLVNVKGSK